MPDSLISIICPNYNKAKYIRQTLESVLSQSYQNWECIIVDDHSTDDSWDIILSFVKLDARFRAYKRPSNLAKGGNVCRNYGFKNSVGDFVLFLDTDDLLMPFCLRNRMAFIYENPNKDFWAFSTALFSKEISDAQFLWNNDNSEESDLSRFLRMDPLWQTSGPIYSKEFISELNAFTPERPFWQDYEVHIKAILKTNRYKKFFHLSPDVFIRNGDSSSLSRSTPFTGDLDVLEKRIEFLQEIKNYALERSVSLSDQEQYSLLSFQVYLVYMLWVKHGRLTDFLKQLQFLIRDNFLPQKYVLIGFIEALQFKFQYRGWSTISFNFFGKNTVWNSRILENSKIGLIKIDITHFG